MEEKSIWMVLFFVSLGMSVLLAIFLVRTAGGLESKKESDKLKVKYADLADKHAKMLEAALPIKTEEQKPAGAASDVTDFKARAEQLEKEVEELKVKINQSRRALLNNYTDDAQINKEIIRLETEATEYSKKGK